MGPPFFSRERVLKKLVFFGDGLLCPPAGYGEQVVDLLVMRHPGAAIKSFHPGEERLTLESALNGLAPVIGKAPDFVHLGLGHPDLLNGASPGSVVRGVGAVVQTLAMKTQAVITIANLCEAFLPEGMRGAARECNVGLASLADMDRVRLADLNGPVLEFLEKHRKGGGEKRSLHENALKLTPMGRVFLSHTAFGLLGLAGFFPE